MSKKKDNAEEIKGIEQESDIVKESENKEVDEIALKNIEIKALKSSLMESNEKYLRALAEAENQRKRIEEDNKRVKDFAVLNLLEEIIEPIGVLEKVVNTSVDNPLLANYLKGFQMLTDQLLNKLKSKGLSEIKEVGIVFNPSIHEAFETIHDETKKDNEVIEIISKGYKYKDYLVKPAKVKLNVLKEEK